MLSLPPLVSLSVLPSVFLRVSRLLTCAHAVISSSLSILLCISLCRSLLLPSPPSDRGWQLPSGLFQAPAHSHTLLSFHTFSLSLFVTCSCNFSIPPVWLRLLLSVQLGLRSEARRLSAEDLDGDKRHEKKRGVTPLLLPSSAFFPPVHLVAHSGEGISHCAFLPWASASLSAHLSFIYNEVSDIPVPAVAQTPSLFGMPSQSWPTCPDVCSSPLFPQFIYLSYLSVCWPACHSFCQINRSSTYQFVLLTGLPFLPVGLSCCSFFPPLVKSVKLILRRPLNEPRSGILSYWSRTVWLLRDFLCLSNVYTVSLCYQNMLCHPHTNATHY